MERWDLGGIGKVEGSRSRGMGPEALGSREALINSQSQIS